MSHPILRRQRCLSVVIAAAFVLLPGAVLAAEADPVAGSTPPARGPEKPQDFYAKRATALLKSEDPEPALHPLAARLPDSIVVVCEAGCPTGAAEVVYHAPRPSDVSSPEAAAAAAADLEAECVAGCYALKTTMPAR